MGKPTRHPDPAFIPKAASIFTMAVGSIVLLGWLFDVTTLKGVHAGWVTMKVNTAVAFLAAGASLWLLSQKRPSHWDTSLGYGLAAVVAVIGFLTFNEDALGTDLHIDQILFSDGVGTVSTKAPGRMAPATALCFVMVGISLVLVERRTRGGHQPAQVLALGPALIGLFGSIGYVYGLTPVYQFRDFTGMAMNTALTFLILGTGILYVHSDRGFMGYITGARPGAQMARRLIPTVVPMYIFLGWLRLAGEDAGLYSADVGVVLLTSAGITSFLVFVVMGARLLNVADIRRDQAEDKILTKGTLLSESQRIAHVGSWEVNLETGKLTWSDELYRIYEVDPYTFEHTPGAFIELIHQDDREMLQEWIAGILAGQEPKEHILRRILRDGSIRYIHGQGTLKCDEHGKPTRVIGMAQDVTERRHMEELIRESERRFRNLAESLPQLVWTCLPDGSCDFLSSQWVEYTGIPEERQLNFAWLEQVHQDDRKVTMNAWSVALEKGILFECEYRLRRHDGAYRWFKTRATRVYDVETGKLMRWVGSSTDVEDMKQSDEAVRKLNQDLESRVAERTFLLQAANRELEAFAYSISHDLRAPLRAIDGFSMALLEDHGEVLDDKGKEYLGRVRNATQAMGHQIDAVLDLSRIDRAPLRMERVNLSDLADVIVNDLRTAYPERTVDVTVAPEMTAVGDTHLLRLLIQNLLENAWKFSSKSVAATIEFKSLLNNGHEVFFVRDNGVGFDMANADKLFVPFQRLHRSADYPGTGVGLSSARRIINRHNGRLWVESRPQKGATFYFSFDTDEGIMLDRTGLTHDDGTRSPLHTHS